MCFVLDFVVNFPILNTKSKVTGITWVGNVHPLWAEDAHPKSVTTAKHTDEDHQWFLHYFSNRCHPNIRLYQWLNSLLHLPEPDASHSSPITSLCCVNVYSCLLRLHQHLVLGWHPGYAWMHYFPAPSILGLLAWQCNYSFSCLREQQSHISTLPCGSVGFVPLGNSHLALLIFLQNSNSYYQHMWEGVFLLNSYLFCYFSVLTCFMFLFRGMNLFHYVCKRQCKVNEKKPSLSNSQFLYINWHLMLIKEQEILDML